jgi:hypothetical protein
MSFEQLRELVMALIEPQPEPQDDAANEFDTQVTACWPSTPRTNTLDDLIASLRTAPAPAPQAPPTTSKPRRRV